jgi:hypothetical protein
MQHDEQDKQDKKINNKIGRMTRIPKDRKNNAFIE